MKNEEVLYRLRQGSLKWNLWRRELSVEEKLHLSSVDLSSVDLSSVDLSGIDLSSINLTEANFSQANLRGANLSRTNLIGGDLSEANLCEADLCGANLGGASLEGTLLEKVNFSEANLTRASLEGTRLAGVNFSEANLTGANFEKAKLVQTSLQGTTLTKINLRGADLEETDLSEASLTKINLKEAILRRANLSGSNLSEANLSEANLSGANLNGANLNGANLSGANLNGADLKEINLKEAKLSRVDLSGANLYRIDLSGKNLSKTNFRGANLIGANLIGANLSEANLSEASLAVVQALGTDFSGAILTGACIADWHINFATKLGGVDCEYVYLKTKQQERRPSDLNRIFAKGEFTQLFQKALETVDLIFAGGIDWKAFLQSFQELQQQHPDEELSIQAIERKSGGALVIRLEVAAELDKAAIEREVREKYEVELETIQAQLQLQSERIVDFQQNVEAQRQASTNLTRIIQTMAEKETAKYDLRGSKFGGGFAAEGGLQVGGTYNDFSQTIGNNLDEIQQLIAALRSQAEGFPEDKRDEAEVHLEDLENDIQQPEKRDPKRIKARLLALLAIASVLGSTVATGTDFANNVLELGKKFGLELVHPQPSQQAKPIDVKSIKPG